MKVADQCTERVYAPGDAWHPYRCSRKATRDGFCKQHHPDSEAARRAKSRAKWEAQLAAERAARQRPINIESALRLALADYDRDCAALARICGHERREHKEWVELARAALQETTP